MGKEGTQKSGPLDAYVIVKPKSQWMNTTVKSEVVFDSAKNPAMSADSVDLTVTPSTPTKAANVSAVPARSDGSTPKCKTNAVS